MYVDYTKAPSGAFSFPTNRINEQQPANVIKKFFIYFSHKLRNRAITNMTRINSGIDHSKLVNAHAFAEYRELTRIPTDVLSGKANLNKIPGKFTLNTGHESFFYDKQLYLMKRYKMLLKSVIERGYNINAEIVARNITNFVTIQRDYPHLWNDYDDSNDSPILIERITERLMGMKNLKYFNQKITKEKALEILNS